MKVVGGPGSSCGGRGCSVNGPLASAYFPLTPSNRNPRNLLRPSAIPIPMQYLFKRKTRCAALPHPPTGHRFPSAFHCTLYPSASRLRCGHLTYVCLGVCVFQPSVTLHIYHHCVPSSSVMMMFLCYQMTLSLEVRSDWHISVLVL